MFYSADEMYDDEITSGPYDRAEINFEAAAAELRAPLLPESANCYEDADDAEQDDAHLPDPLAKLEDGQ
ncbi:hypothetical protein [Deinococcus marmoris]|uniref:Uncharacterized protein n=1 Tax=Deinococcus marmoris TaxID=249408 RepID=A0A1U7NW43_9DEIO|nr:hypothetical protein [Deinococcus marmoris]OLV17153.1 hypothetical protein BOO71_0009760 [Deinococcus marmoris]